MLEAESNLACSHNEQDVGEKSEKTPQNWLVEFYILSLENH